MTKEFKIAFNLERGEASPIIHPLVNKTITKGMAKREKEMKEMDGQKSSSKNPKELL